MTRVVTGGAGFIGGNFIHYMLDARPGDRVVCYGFETLPLAHKRVF
jgi:dTDP-glucose 4,6-dehydratase